MGTGPSMLSCHRMRRMRRTPKTKSRESQTGRCTRGTRQRHLGRMDTRTRSGTCQLRLHDAQPTAYIGHRHHEAATHATAPLISQLLNAQRWNTNNPSKYVDEWFSRRASAAKYPFHPRPATQAPLHPTLDNQMPGIHHDPPPCGLLHIHCRPA